MPQQDRTVLLAHTRRDRWLPVAALAVAIYTPLLATAPGRVAADTKSYLYLDPSRLLSRAWSMWDPSVGLGTVSHQTIGYLWPMGPWFWVFERLGVPDWVAQRLWLGTILVAAGAGVLWLLRRVLGWATAPAVAAAFLYACTPYVLTLAARLSVILLPFAGLPWLIGLAALSVRTRTWRYPAAFALVVATVGSVNATALVLAGVGPVLWLVHARLVGEAGTRDVLAAAARIGVLTVVANLWWLAGLWAQGGYGIEILRYTETAEVVASAAVAAEVLRGLGYWFFYGGDRLGPWIEPGADYTQRLPLLGLTYAIPVVALLAAGLTRWRERAFFVTLVVVGTLAAVGAHPWDDPPPGGVAVKALLESDAGLAMRSLPRAAPLVALGLAVLLGAGVASLGRWVRPAAVAAAVAAYAALPPLWTGGMVPSNLDRDEDVPGYWLDAADHLDGRERGTRVLELPGVDFATYRWGNTVDPITPGLIDRPYVARELIPYGSAESADLLAALDRRIQERTLEPGALAVLARLMGVGDVVLRDDLQFERHRTPRPYDLAPRLDDEPGLGQPVAFGSPVVNDPDPEVPLVDELALLEDDREPRPPVEVFPVDDPVAIVRTAPAQGGVVLAGDGEGLVDAASAGLLDGDQLVRYGASLGRAGVEAALEDGAVLVITDGNRRQGRRWSTVRDTLGFVEGTPVVIEDLTDNRLPLFPDAEDGWQTTAAPIGGVRATATSYGNPISFTPEYRPSNAVDGDVATEWRTGANADVRGERLVLAYDPPVAATSITVVQQLSGFRNRHVAEIAVRVDDGPPVRVGLDERSLTPDGQTIELPVTEVGRVEIEVLADTSGREARWGRPVRYTNLTQIGFAEVRVDAAGGEPERLVLPPAAMSAVGTDTPVALVLTRWRTDPTDVVRQDPEPALAREWDQPVARQLVLTGTARPAPDAPDRVLDELLGVTGPAVTSSSRLHGAVEQRGSAALDGDPSTWWSPAFGDPEPALTVTTAAPVTVDRLDVAVVDDGRRSVPTRLRIEADGSAPVRVDVPDGGGRIDVPRPLTASRFRFVIEAVAERTAVEWFSDAPVVVPPAIAELGVPQLAVGAGRALGTACRDDLLTLDGAPVPVLVQAGEVLGCGGAVEIGAGSHTLLAAPGRETGIDVDQLVLSSELPGSRADDRPDVEVLDDGRASVRVRVTGATPGEPFWFVLGQSFNSGWSLDGRPPALVDGYANGWLVTPASATIELAPEWRPQRVVTAALVLSAVAVLGCLLLCARQPSQRAPTVAQRRFTRDETVGARRSWVVPVVAGALSLVWIGPVSAVVVTGAAAAGGRCRRVRRWLRFGPAAVLALAAGYVLARQVLAAPPAAFEWPAELATVHQPALVAVALLAVVAALDRRD